VATEQFANNAQSNLSAAVAAGDTSLTVVNASAFPASGNFRVLIDGEILLVTGVSGNTFTVSRGAEGTTAAAHANAAYVTHVLTAAALRNCPRSMTASGDLEYLAASGAVTRLGIGSAGQLLTVSGGLPSWAAPPTLQAGWMHSASDQGINNSTVTLVNLDTSDLATANVTCDTSGHAITTNFAGKVLVSCGAYWKTAAGSGSFYVRVTQNGTIILEGQIYEVAGSDPGPALCRCVACASGDVFKFYVANFTGATETVSGGTAFLQVTQQDL
jgi:hypothetical protein